MVVHTSRRKLDPVQEEFMHLRRELGAMGITIVENIHDEYVLNYKDADGDGGEIATTLAEARRIGREMAGACDSLQEDIRSAKQFPNA